MKLKNGTEVISLKSASGYDICHEVSADEPLWIMQDTCGIRAIVSGRSYEDAYSIVRDLQPTIDVDEVKEAHGSWDHLRKLFIGEDSVTGPFFRTNLWRAFCDDCAKLGRSTQFFADRLFDARIKLDPDFEPELIEGYEYQSNASGTGIVSIDLNGESLEPLDVETIKCLGINMQISSF